MNDDYESRLVDNTLINDAVIDTVAINDSKKPFETGIKHPSYNDGKWVVVELYNTKEEAQAGHDKWVAIFKKGLPDSLTDVNESIIGDFAENMGCPVRVTHKRKE